jgi:hypothetical protein
MALAILSLEAGPWQFDILGFFIAVLTLAPMVLWALERGWWPLVLIGSWLLFAAGRRWAIDVLPSQSERPFPLLVWQVLFVNGVVIGWHRERLVRRLGARRRLVFGVVMAVALGAVAVRLAGPAVLGADAWERWRIEHFDKRSLDPARLATMMSITAALYLALRRHVAGAERTIGRVLLPLGRNSFYVFIVHVFMCLAVASAIAASRAALGEAGNALLQIAAVLLLWHMVRRRCLFRWIPR